MTKLISQEKTRWALLTLGLILCLATIIRGIGVTSRTLTHIEIYVPGIHLPEGSATPGSRLTVRDTLVGLLNEVEPHPPGYYLLMLAWTRVFGSGVISLRTPSLLFGVGGVALIYLLAMLERDRLVGLLAALLLALNGHQALWSQLAKGYMLAALLGLGSTVLLVLAMRSRQQNLLGKLYTATVLCGVAVTHFFWPLFIAQILWVFLVTWTRASRSPGLLHWQAAAFILGAPLLALAVFQARRPSYIGQASLPLSVVEFFEFGFLFEPDPFATGPTLVLWLLAAAAFGLTVALVVAGMLAGRTQTPASRPAVSDATPVPAWVLGLLAAGSILFTVRLALFVRAWDAHQARITAIVALLPIVIVGLDVLLRRCWPRLQDVLRRSRHRTLLEKLGELRVSTVLAVVPGAMLLVVSLVTPVFVSRTMLLFTPYVVVLVAAGLAALLKRPKVGVPVVLAVLLLHGASLRYYAVSHHEDPIDYRGLAEAWLPRIEAGDAVFVVRHWVTTPIFYYLDAEQNRVVHEDYAQALAEAPARRVWVLSFPYVSVPIGSALDGYRETEQLEARGIGVSLFEKAATESPATGASLGSPMRWVDPLHKTGIGRGVAAIGKGGSWLVDTGAGKDSR